jgi:hypothetical protein
MNQKRTDNLTLILRLFGLAIYLALSAHGRAAEENKNAPYAFPGTDAGAISLVKEFVKPGADLATLSKQLRPTASDYAAVFEPDLDAKVKALWDPGWDSGELIIAPNTGQTEVKLSSTTSAEMKSWTGSAATDFAGGWRKAAPKLKAGLKIYGFDFLAPGETLGMSFEGLIHVNGHWRIFPKPWRAMEK